MAGLVVAPTAVCAWLGLRAHGSRLLAFAAVTLPFVTLNLSPELSDGVERASAALGVPMRIWCDPSDLWACAVLPWVYRTTANPRPLPAGLHAWSGRVGLALAALACAATSIADEGQELLSPFLINWTRAPIDVEIAARDGVDCASLEPPALPVARRQSLPPGQLMELLPLSPASSPAGSGAQDRCSAARISLVDGPVLELRWESSVNRPLSVQVDQVVGPSGDRAKIDSNDAWAFDHAITVLGPAADLRFEVGSGLATDGGL